MSFSKSRVKRFIDTSTDVCAPPVGTYDPKLPESCLTSGQFSSSAVERLKDFPDGPCSASSMSRCLPTDLVNRKNVGQLPKSNSSKHSSVGSSRLQGKARIQQYEQEIKQLLMERSALLKQLTTKDQEGKKIYSRMQAAIRERNSFQASVATFEKENKELRRINEIYKIKFETFEGDYKKKDVNMELANLRAKLASKNHQISDLRLEMSCIREELEYSSMKLSDKYRGIAKISALMVDAMEILKGELKRLKDHVVKMQITEECAEEFYECISAQLQNLDEKMLHYRLTVHEIIQDKEISVFKSSLCNGSTPKKLRNALVASDELSDDLTTSQHDDQDSQKHDMELVMSSTLDSEHHQKVQTAESYFEYLEKCRFEDENELKNAELVGQVEKELPRKGLETLPKPEQLVMEAAVTELRSELQLLKDENEKLKLELELCKKSCISSETSLKEQVAKAEETFELKTIEIGNLNRSIEALSSQLASVDKALKEELQKSTLQTHISEEKSRQIANLEDMLQAAKVHEASLKSELSTHISNSNSFREEMSGKLHDNAEALILLKNEINTRETKINSLVERESLLLGQIDVLIKKENIADEIAHKLTLQNSELMDAVTSYKSNLAENTAKVKEYELLVGDLKDELAIQIQQKENVAKELVAQNELRSALHAEYEQCQVVNGQLQEERNLLTGELQNTSQNLKFLKEELAAEITKCDNLKEALNEKEKEAQELLDKLQESFEANDRSVNENNDIEEMKKELLSWKTQCEELQAKIAPFQEQLDSYAIDRQMLMSKNMETISDLKALSLQYATSLGHQNRKQKIHYMFNLKEENFNLKEANILALKTPTQKFKSTELGGALQWLDHKHSENAFLTAIDVNLINAHENGKLWADILKLRNSLKRDTAKTPSNLGRLGSSPMPRSIHTPLNKENKDSGTNTPLRDCSNSDK